MNLEEQLAGSKSGDNSLWKQLYIKSSASSITALSLF